MEKLTEKEKKEWKKLYSVAEEIQKIEPWKYLNDMDILTLTIPEVRDIIYCNVMGKAGMHKGIAIYFGDQLTNFLDHLDDIPTHMILNYNECLICQYIPKRETMPENMKLMEELGVSYQKEWISFECMEKGYAPRKMDTKDVGLMTSILENFYQIFTLVATGDLKADFENGETILRRYEEEKDCFQTLVMPQMIFEPSYIQMMEMGKDLKNAVKKLETTPMVIEYDFLNYLPMPIGKEGDKIIYPRIQIMAEHNSQMLLDMHLVEAKKYDNEIQYAEECANSFIDFLLQVGKPKMVLVRDEASLKILEPITKAVGIKLKISPKLKAIDFAEQDFMKQMRER